MKRNVSVVCVCSAPNILINGNIIKEMPGSVASGTPYTLSLRHRLNFEDVGDSVVGITSRYGLGGPRFKSGVGEIFCAVQTCQPPVKCIWVFSRL